MSTVNMFVKRILTTSESLLENINALQPIFEDWVTPVTITELVRVSIDRSMRTFYDCHLLPWSKSCWTLDYGYIELKLIIFMKLKRIIVTRREKERDLLADVHVINIYLSDLRDYQTFNFHQAQRLMWCQHHKKELPKRIPNYTPHRKHLTLLITGFLV